MQWSIIAKVLSRVLNLLLNVRETVIDFLQFGLVRLYILADCGEIVLDLSQLVGVSPIVSSHTLEVSTQDGLLSRNLLECAGGVILESLQHGSELGQFLANFSSIGSGLLQMGSPLFAAFSLIFANLQLVGNTLNLQLPLLLADIGVDDGVLLHLSLHLTS